MKMLNFNKDYTPVPQTEYQGLAWNEVSDTYARQGTLAGQTLAVSPGDLLLPIQSKMRGCVVSDAGVVQYYLSSTDWAYKESGADSNLTGADGQVMVEVPKFYQRKQKNGDWHIWDHSIYPLTGFTVHPAFVVAGVEKDHIYISAYEGISYDTSASRYTNGLYLSAVSCVFDSAAKSLTIALLTNPFTALQVGDKIVVTGTTSNNATFTVATAGNQTIVVTEAVTNETAASTVVQTQKDFTATTGDKLSSVAGKVPINYATRANFRQMAKNRGVGWHQMSYDEVHAVQLLLLIEFGSFYVQNIATVGPGLTGVTDWTAYSNSNPFNISGSGNAVGNASADNATAAACATMKTQYSRYRGIENVYGHVWKSVDGININSNHPYITNNNADFADDTATGYTDTGVTLAAADGYQKTLVNSARAMLPSSVGGGASASTFIPDYYYQAAGWRMAVLGGKAADGANAGAWLWGLGYVAGILHQGISSRVVFS